MKKFNWHSIRLIGIMIFMMFLYSFSTNRNENRLLNKITIKFINNNDKLLITDEIVNNLLKQKLGGTFKIKKVGVDLTLLENTLNSNNLIEKAQVFSTIEGDILAKIEQKSPIVRLYSQSDVCYLDKNGVKMPLSDNFSVRVPLVYGNLKQDELERYALLFNTIDKDAFLKKNIAAIQILPSGNVILNVREYNYKIVFGQPVHVEDKLANYKAFYYHATKDTLLKSYKEISLLFTKQVVAKK